MKSSACQFLGHLTFDFIPSFPWIVIYCLTCDHEGLLSFDQRKLISKDSRQAFEKRSQLIIEDLSGKKHFRYAFSTEDKSSQ